MLTEAEPDESDGETIVHQDIFGDMGVFLEMDTELLDMHFEESAYEHYK